MKQIILDNVRPSSTMLDTIGTGREGAVIATQEQLTELLGNPFRYTEAESDGKFTVEWYLATPRGPVCVHDYWWNKPDEFSLGGKRLAVRWAAAWFRAHGLTATQTYEYAMTEFHRHGYNSIGTLPYRAAWLDQQAG